MDRKTHSDLLWPMGGHLNEVFYHYEKQGGSLQAQVHIDDFRNAFIDNNLHDLGFSRYDFTWCNNRGGEDVVEEHLDRFSATTEWFVPFSEAQVQHIDLDISDHLPILLRCKVREHDNNT